MRGGGPRLKRLGLTSKGWGKERLVAALGFGGFVSLLVVAACGDRAVDVPLLGVTGLAQVFALPMVGNLGCFFGVVSSQ